MQGLQLGLIYVPVYLRSQHRESLCMVFLDYDLLCDFVYEYSAKYE